MPGWSSRCPAAGARDPLLAATQRHPAHGGRVAHHRRGGGGACRGREGYRLFNLRVSKLGGLTAAHRVARIAGENGVRLQVGCQVGESSLLSAAGRLLGATLPEIEALEGSYGTRLLESDVTDEPFEFGQGGAPWFSRRRVSESRWHRSGWRLS